MKVPPSYKGAKIVVTSQGPYDEFFAVWHLDAQLKPVIVLDAAVAAAVEANQVALAPTLAHEYDEALLAIELAKQAGKTTAYMRKYYTGPQAIKARELDGFGGLAHEKLIGAHPGGHSAYNKLIEAEWDIVYPPTRVAWDEPKALHLRSAKAGFTACGMKLGTKRCRSTDSRSSVTCGDCRQIMDRIVMKATAAKLLKAAKLLLDQAM